MKKGLWVLTFLGVAGGVAFHQLTAQESRPAPLPPAAAIADKVAAVPPAVAFPAEPSADRVSERQAAVKDLTIPEMRQMLKRWQGEEIDGLDQEALRKRVQEERNRRDEARVAARLESMAEELLIIARDYAGSKNGKRAEWAYRSLLHGDDLPNLPPGSTFEPIRKNSPAKQAEPQPGPIRIE